MLFRQAGNDVCVKSRIHKNVPQLHHYKLEDNCVKNAGNPLSSSQQFHGRIFDTKSTTEVFHPHSKCNKKRIKATSRHCVNKQNEKGFPGKTPNSKVRALLFFKENCPSFFSQPSVVG